MSLAPDAVVVLAGVLNILAMIDFDLRQAAFIAAETGAFLFGRERRRQRQRRRRNFQVVKKDELAEPLLGDREARDRFPGAGGFFVPFEGGTQVHAVSFMQGGGGQTTGLLCLHQFGSGTFTFDRLAAELRNFQDFFSCMHAFDRPGHGQTSRPENPDMEIYEKIPWYSAECGVRLTEFLVNEISGRATQGPLVLVGCGQGALLALEVAARRTSAEICGLVLISPPTEDAEFADGLPRVVKGAALTKVGTQISSALLKAELGDFLVKRAWHKELPDELLDKYRRATQTPGWAGGITALIKHYRKREIHKNILAPRLIRPLGLPVLVVVGSNDRVVREPKAKEFVDALKTAGLQAELVVIKNCGHVPHEEEPKLVAELIATFLRKLPSFTQLV